MKYGCLLVLLICCLLLFFNVSKAAETVGEANYTYIGISDFDFADVCIDGLGMVFNDAYFNLKAGKSYKNIGDANAFEITNMGSYGGMIVYICHGDYDGLYGGFVELETFPYTSSGQTDAFSRKQFLVDAGRFTSNDLGVAAITEGTYHYSLVMFNSGIQRHFGGDNGLAVIIACISNGTAGSWGARVEVGYNYKVNNVTAKADFTSLCRDLTGDMGSGSPVFDRMTVGQAVPQTTMMVMDGSSDTALIPWVSSISPDNTIPQMGGDIMMTFDLGVKMRQEPPKPFIVQGPAIAKSPHEWTSDTRARVMTYSGWEIGSFYVGFGAGQLESNKGIKLLGGASWIVEYTSAVNTWPPAASVNAFIPIYEGGQTRIMVDLLSMKGSESFWIERDNGVLIGDTVRVSEMDGHKFSVVDFLGQTGNVYNLFEREYDGDVFVRATEGVLSSEPEVVFPKPRFDPQALTAQLQSRISAFTGLLPGFNIGMVICPDSFATSAQIYADYWTAHNRPVKVVTLSECGSTREEIRACIEQAYADGVRYVLLLASASDAEWFDDPSKWPDLPGEDDWFYWFQDYHTPGGFFYFVSHPERNLIPTYFVDDSAYDNMSYWTPYFTTDKPYVSGLLGMRIGRVPAYNNARFLAWLNKNLDYCDNSGTYLWADDIGVWGQCHNWDGNSGEMILNLINDHALRIPPSLFQHHLIDTTWTYAEREAFALSAWNSGRGIIYMRGTSSNYYKPIHFFAKSAGWHVGLLSSGKYPLVVGVSCAIGTHDMAIDPDYGDHFATEVLTADNTRGTHAMIAPSRGTWTEGNRQIADAFNQYASVSPAQDQGTAFMMAQDEVINQGEQILLALSYSLLGDPLAPLPGRSVATGIEDQRPVYENSLFQNYPNPFNPVTTISFMLSKRSHVSIRIYNVAGQLVETLINDVRSAGPQKVVWEASGKASGVYFYRLNAGTFSQTKKMVLLK